MKIPGVSVGKIRKPKVTTEVAVTMFKTLSENPRLLLIDLLIDLQDMTIGFLIYLFINDFLPRCLLEL